MSLLSATNVQRVLFNDPVKTLTTTAFTTATFVNTAGAGLSSGTGKIVFDRAFHNEAVYFILPDRSSFSVPLLSATNETTVTLTPNGFEAWGPTERRLRHLEYI
jgi:hypothetical protein